MSIYDFRKKKLYLVEFLLKEAKNDIKFVDQWLYTVTNNAITSEVNKIFS